MIDLTTISPEQLIARGSYSTVRSAEEDRKKALTGTCQEIMRVAPVILKQGQALEAIDEARKNIEYARRLIDEAAAEIDAIESLAKQKAELRQAAWGK